MIGKIKKIQSLFSVLGYENKLTGYIVNEIEEYCDECFIDKLGNVICHKKGKGDKLLISLPVSSDGLFLTHIAEDGAGKFKTVGSLKAEKLTGNAVKDEDGNVCGVIYSSCEEIKDTDDLYIDFGVLKKEDVKYNVGDVLALSESFENIGDNIYGNGISRCACIYAILSVIKKVKSNYDLYFAFTIMDNAGFKGAKTSAFSINPDLCITCSSSFSDMKESSVKLGLGPVIRIKDSHIIVNKHLRDTLIKKAENIPYQLEVLSKEGLSSNEIMYLGNGILTANINIPAKGFCEEIKCVNVNDIKNYEEYILKILNQE